MKNVVLKKVDFGGWKKVLFFEKSCSCDVYHSITDEEEVKNYVRDDEVYFVVLDGDEVGTVSYEDKEGRAHVTGLTILPEYRGRGIATFVIWELLKKLKSLDNVSLDVHPENSPAIILYLKNGFVIKKWNANRFGEGEHRLFLVRDLKN